MATISGTAQINSIRLVEQANTPSTPASGYSAIFAKSDGLYIVDDAGNVTGPFKAGNIAGDVLWDAKGDLVVGSGADTAGRLAVGTNGKVLTANSGATAGVEWATPKTVATDVIWAAKGDLAVGTGSDTAAVLTVGTDGYILQAASGEATGVKWVVFPGILASLIDAKGDLLVGSADNTAAKLTVGTDGHVLTADAAATNGVKWAAVAAGASALDDLTDVDTTGFGDGDVLTYSTGSSAWVAAAPAAASGDVATDTIWAAKGDLAVATANDTAAVLTVGANGTHLVADSGEATGLKWEAQTRYIVLGSSGTLTASAKTLRKYIPWACTVINVAASVGTAPTGASVIVDVLKNGTTLWGTNPSNRPTITATNFADLTNTPDTTAIAAGDYLTLTVAQIGLTIAGADLDVTITVTVP